MEETRKKVDIWSIFMYLILYSMAGFVIETVFGAFTKGVIESRKSFLYGPFCAIYGIGAIAMIVLLRKPKSNIRLFLGGAMIGAVVEYLMSFVCEKFFGVKWWDYSGAWLNIQGRTCLFYAVSWGFLAIVLLIPDTYESNDGVAVFTSTPTLLTLSSTTPVKLSCNFF